MNAKQPPKVNLKRKRTEPPKVKERNQPAVKSLFPMAGKRKTQTDNDTINKDITIKRRKVENPSILLTKNESNSAEKFNFSKGIHRQTLKQSLPVTVKSRSQGTLPQKFGYKSVPPKKIQ